MNPPFQPKWHKVTIQSIQKQVLLTHLPPTNVNLRNQHQSHHLNPPLIIKRLMTDHETEESATQKVPGQRLLIKTTVPPFNTLIKQESP